MNPGHSNLTPFFLCLRSTVRGTRVTPTRPRSWRPRSWRTCPKYRVRPSLSLFFQVETKSPPITTPIPILLETDLTTTLLTHDLSASPTTFHIPTPFHSNSSTL